MISQPHREALQAETEREIRMPQERDNEADTGGREGVNWARRKREKHIYGGLGLSVGKQDEEVRDGHLAAGFNSGRRLSGEAGEAGWGHVTMVLHIPLWSLGFVLTVVSSQ